MVAELVEAAARRGRRPNRHSKLMEPEPFAGSFGPGFSEHQQRSDFYLRKNTEAD
jgi:hypothetical protein